MTPARADQLAAPLRECPLLFSLSARRAAASQDPTLRSAGASRDSLLRRLPAGNLEALLGRTCCLAGASGEPQP